MSPCQQSSNSTGNYHTRWLHLVTIRQRVVKHWNVNKKFSVTRFPDIQVWENTSIFMFKCLFKQVFKLDWTKRLFYYIHKCSAEIKEELLWISYWMMVILYIHCLKYWIPQHSLQSNTACTIHENLEAASDSTKLYFCWNLFLCQSE